MATCIEAQILFRDSSGNEQGVTVRESFDELPSIYEGKVILASMARDIVRDSLTGGAGKVEFVDANYRVWEC